VNDPKSKRDDPAQPRDPRFSPIRPTPPDAPPPKPPAAKASSAPVEPDSTVNPYTALNTLRRKMEAIADEFAQGKINRVQFHALYKRYSEQRAIIERLVERNPQSEAWKQVIAVKGQTGFLRHHYEAQALYFIVYHPRIPQPILGGGRQTPDERLITPMVKAVWTLPNRPKNALGRKPVGDTQWLILAVGEYAATAVMFSLEPAMGQARLVRDLHADFERANGAALARGWVVPERMVFPQRALVEGEF
jgi:hypothetical protein